MIQEIVCAAIQRDLGRLEKWVQRNLMKFHKGKCNVSHQDMLSASWLESSLAEKDRPGGPGRQHIAAQASNTSTWQGQSMASWAALGTVLAAGRGLCACRLCVSRTWACSLTRYSSGTGPSDDEVQITSQSSSKLTASCWTFSLLMDMLTQLCGFLFSRRKETHWDLVSIPAGDSGKSSRTCSPQPAQ